MTDVDVRLEDGILWATLNRPQVLNAVRGQTLREVSEVLERAAREDAVRCVVLTGSGRAFSAGQDLAELEHTLGSGDETQWRAGLADFQRITKLMLGLPKPIVAALNGAATGFGAELALACDVRIASVSARIGFVEARRALFQTNGVMWLLPRIIGHGAAMRMVLTGELLDGAEAARIGLVSEVVGNDQLLDRAAEIARAIADNAPLSVRRAKRLLLRSWDMPLADVMAEEVEGMLESLRSEDLVEGTRAFLEKRPPEYRGC